MAKTHFIIPFFIPHTGCPYDCVFCNQRKITGRQERVRPEDILPTIEEYLATIPPSPRRVEVAFFGGSFTGIPLGLQEAYLREAKKALTDGKIDSIRLSTRPDYINRQILNLLKDYGVDTIELGVQSLDDEVLGRSCRGHSSKEVVEASKLIRRYGFTLGLQIMIGLPGDTKEKDLQTARKVCRLDPAFVRIYPTLVIKDTALETMYRKGLYRPLDLQEAVDICTDLVKIFIKGDIKVIRIGLQPTDRIATGKDVVAGPFHPSFRQIVESSLIREVIAKSLRKRGICGDGKLEMEVHPSMVSTVVGIRRDSINRLSLEFPGIEFKVKPNKNLGKSDIRIRYKQTGFAVDYIEEIKSEL